MGKEEKMRRISCFLLMLTLLLTTAVVAWGTVPTDGEVTPSLVNVSRSKTATVLDKDYQSTVTLSLPSAEENWPAMWSLCWTNLQAQNWRIRR